MVIAISDEVKNKFLIKGYDLSGREHFYSYPKFPSMPKKIELVIGFDQSTTQTGLAIKTKDGRLVALFDFCNLGIFPNALYETMLEFTLTDMFKDSKVSLIVLEKPFQGKAKGSYETLVKLKGFLETLKYKIPAFSEAKLAEIYPQSWRAKFLVDNRYKGRKKKTADLKECAREETYIRYPNFETYVRKWSKPMDSCDAIGVLDGYLETNVAETGLEVVNKSMQINWNIKYQSKIVLLEEYNEAEIEKQLAEWCPFRAYLTGWKLMQYNSGISMRENGLLAVSSCNEVCVLEIRDTKCDSIFMWESGKMRTDGQIFAMLAYRENLSDKYNQNVQLGKENLYGIKQG